MQYESVEKRMLDKSEESQENQLESYERARMMSVGETGTGSTDACKNLAHKMNIQLTY